MGSERFVERVADVVGDVPSCCDECGRGTLATLVVGDAWVCDACAEGIASEIERLIREARDG